MDNKIITIYPMNKELFKTYIMFTVEPSLDFYVKELEHYCNSDLSIIGLVLLDKIDNDFAFVIICKDEHKKYRAIESIASIDSQIEAKERLHQRMRKLTLDNVKQEKQGVKDETGIDIYKRIVDVNKLHPHFIKLCNNPAFYPSKSMIKEIAKFYQDIDGNFVEQFQSLNGFDSRLWELYLFTFLTEQRFNFVSYKDNRPDFMVQKFNQELAIEAVTVARKERVKKRGVIISDIIEVKDQQREDKEKKNDMPLRFGNALFSKLNKKYWELEHVKEKPILIAVADFHENMSMTWSHSSIIEYLYGINYSYYYDDNGQLILKTSKIDDYIKPNGTKIEANYFNQPNAEYISGILFSPTATISKFTRIGVQNGFINNNQTVTRVGFRHDHDKNASKPQSFIYEVDMNSGETWSEGMNLFHNPNAKYPIDRSLFTEIAQHWLVNGEVRSDIPSFHPYSSITENILY